MENHLSLDEKARKELFIDLNHMPKIRRVFAHAGDRAGVVRMMLVSATPEVPLGLFWLKPPSTPSLHVGMNR